MLNHLRNRLIISHILPLFVIIPIMGIGLIYVLETQVYLPALANEVENDAWLIARLAALDSGMWQDSQQAHELVSLENPRNNGVIKMLDSAGVLLASNDPAEQGRIGEVLASDLNAINPAPGEVIRHVHYNSAQAAEVIEVIVPVIDQERQLLGFVWVDYPFVAFTDEVYQLRFLILSLLALGLVFGSSIGFLLAVSVSTPIRQVTGAIGALAHNTQMKLLPVGGPEEIQLLCRSVNDLVIRLRELEQSRRRLLANLVHEIGRPLGALRSAIFALRQGAAKDEKLYQDLLAGMDDETGRLQELLNELAGLHEQILGTLELERQAINLHNWLPGCLRTWQAAAQEKGIHWEMVIPDGVPVLFADPTRLTQVVGNLANNAVKFTPPGGKILITVLLQAEELGLAIQDTGPGISEEEREQIFQPFYRGTHGRRFPQGMGLGLSIARDLTEAHGGRLEIDSQPGSGSRFTVWLPVGERAA